jgi:hypothetical protein
MIDYSLAAALHGRSADIELASGSLDEQIRDIVEPGGSKYEAWKNGDRRLEEERQELYRRKFPGQIILE